MALWSVACGGVAPVSSAGADGGADADGHVCVYPPVHNDPLCPARYSNAFERPCPSIGLSCAYPGAGDPESDGCNATAAMMCRGEGGAGAPGTWTFAQ